MIKVRLEKNINGEWYTEGTYPIDSSSLIKAIQMLSGYELRLVTI